MSASWSGVWPLPPEAEMLIPASGHPGIHTERVANVWTGEVNRESVYRDLTLIGHVSYLSAPNTVGSGTRYGWVPDLPGRWSLKTKHDAIAALLESLPGE